MTAFVCPLTLCLTFVLTMAVSVSLPTQLAPVAPEQDSDTPATPLLETLAVPPIVSDPGPGRVVVALAANESVPMLA